MDKNNLTINEDYFSLLEKIKKEVYSAQNRAMIKVNTEMIIMYFNIGKYISDNASWGTKFLRNLSYDLANEYANNKGFSVRNLHFMVQFYEAYKDLNEIMKQPVSQLSWGHNIFLLQKFKDNSARLWYAHRAVKEGWSRATLMNAVGLLEQERIKERKTNNFQIQLSDLSKEQQNELYKDPMIFDFIDKDLTLKEKKIEQEMVRNITKVLLELGKGISFVGQQYKIEAGEKDRFIDLLFYIIPLKRYFVIELKPGEFEPSDLGQLGYYVSAIDKLLKTDNEERTIGLLLCRGKDKLDVEIALSNTSNPLPVGEYIYKNEIPDFLQKHLPSIQEIESSLKLLKRNGKGNRSI